QRGLRPALGRSSNAPTLLRVGPDSVSITVEMRQRTRYLAAALVVVVGAVVAVTLRPAKGAAPTGPSLRLGLLHAVAGDARGGMPRARPGTLGRHDVALFPQGTTAQAAPPRVSSPPVFGQPTIA